MYEQIAANRKRTVWLMAIFLVVIIAVGYVFARAYNDPSILIGAVVFSMVMNWISYFKSDQIALLSARAVPVKPERSIEERELKNLVDNLAITSGLPAPKVYVIQDDSPNAFATGRDPKHASIAVTTGLMQLLNKSEMEGVVAHELSHVKNYDILLATVVVTLVGTIALLADWFLRSRSFHYDDDRKSAGIWLVIGLILALLAPIFAQLIQLAISRRREFLADASGAMLTRYPEGLAAALEKLAINTQPLRSANRATAHLFIADPFATMKARVNKLFSTHPPIEERIAALKQMNI